MGVSLRNAKPNTPDQSRSNKQVSFVRDTFSTPVSQNASQSSESIIANSLSTERTRNGYRHRISSTAQGLHLNVRWPWDSNGSRLASYWSDLSPTFRTASCYRSVDVARAKDHSGRPHSTASWCGYKLRCDEWSEFHHPPVTFRSRTPAVQSQSETADHHRTIFREPSNIACS